MDTGYRANPEHFAMQMDVFERMRKIEQEFRAARRPAPVNATRESSRQAGAPVPTRRDRLAPLDQSPLTELH